MERQSIPKPTPLARILTTEEIFLIDEARNYSGASSLMEFIAKAAIEKAHKILSHPANLTRAEAEVLLRQAGGTDGKPGAPLVWKDRVMDRVMGLSGVRREVFIEEFFKIGCEFSRLFDVHQDAFVTAFSFLGDQNLSAAQDLVSDEGGIPAEGAGHVDILEHEVLVKMNFKMGKLKSATLLSDGRILWMCRGSNRSTERSVQP